jgi:predicted dehydrogenase
MTLRFGLLGTGPWAADTHAPALAGSPDADLVAVWGRDPAKAAALADRHGARAYSDVDELLADVDAVAIALPPDTQAPLAARAARAGRHLLLDKPLALDVAAADEVVAAATEAGVASVVFFTRRFRPAIRDFLGTAAAAGGWHGGRASILARVAGLREGVSPWRAEHGGLWDVGPHALSLLLPVLGPVREVVGAAVAPHATTHVLLAHESGAVSTMALSLETPEPAQAFDVVFVGETGWATVPSGSGAVDELGLAVAELAAAAAEGRTDHPCDVRFARDVVAILAAAEAQSRGASAERR